MKNISKQILALAITPMLFQAATAQDSYYVKGEVGVTMPKKIDGEKLKKSAIFGIEGGYKMNDNFRFGLGIGFINKIKPKDTVAGDPKVSTIFAEVNGYYDIADFNGFTPYLTAGVGISRNKLKISGGSAASSSGSGGKVDVAGFYSAKSGSAGGVDPDVSKGVIESISGSSTSKKKTGVAWNIGIGGMYNIDPDFAVDLTYRYRDLGKVKTDKDESKKLKSHNVTVGVVYKF